MPGTIWQRYVFFRLLKGFLFFFLSFFLLYSLIDFSTHPGDFFGNGSLRIAKLYTYYEHQLFKRIELLLPLSLLVSSIRTLTGFNASRELVALQVSGVPLRKIFYPFFLLAALCSTLGYYNEQILLPESVKRLSESGHSSSNKGKQKQFRMITLHDGSKFIFQNFQPENNALFDVYWIPSSKEIWKMKYLNADPASPIGTYVDHIVRNKNGLPEKTESFETLTIPGLKWDLEQLNKKRSSIRYKNLSELYEAVRNGKNESLHFRSEVQTRLFYKLAIPLIPFLVLTGILPFCIRYTRNPPLFAVYGPAIFAFVVFFTLVHAMTIIGENRVLPPWIAIFFPFFLAFFLTSYPFFKTLRR